MYFLRLLDIVSADSDTLVEVLIPPPEGGGELLFADVSQDPIPGRLDRHRLLGQLLARPERDPSSRITRRHDPANHVHPDFRDQRSTATSLLHESHRCLDGGKMIVKTPGYKRP